MRAIAILLAALLVATPAFAVMYTGSTSSSFSVCGVTFSQPWWAVYDSSGNLIFLVDHQGNILVNSDSVYMSASVPSNPSHSLVFQYGGSYIDAISASDAYLAGSIDDHSIPSNPQNSLLVEYQGTIVGAVTPDGSIYAYGQAVYNGARAGCGNNQICVNGQCVTAGRQIT